MLRCADDHDQNNNNEKKKQKLNIKLFSSQLDALISISAAANSPSNSNTNANAVHFRKLFMTATRTGSSSSKSSSTTSTCYRLAWAGSDRAICQIGTGLHNQVALARLQEIFLTLGRQIPNTMNTNGIPHRRCHDVQMIEVLRILGPFPNVKNTLLGTSSITTTRTPTTTTTGAGAVRWKIVWHSIIDGTGKERLPAVIMGGGQAAQQQQTKRSVVELDVLVSAPEMLVCSAVMVESADGDIDRAADHCDNRLVFVKEEEMERKLDSLRVI